MVGCAAIDDLRVSIFQWSDTANLTEEGEEPLAYAPEPRLIPPAEIPKRAAKAPRKVLKAKPQRPPAIVLPQEKLPISDAPETATPGETEGQSARATSIRPRTPYPETPSSFEDRFCAKCWGLPGKLSKCTGRPERRLQWDLRALPICPSGILTPSPITPLTPHPSRRAARRKCPAASVWRRHHDRV